MLEYFFMNNILIRNGTVVTSDSKKRNDVLISNGVIERIGRDLGALQGEVHAIDATGMYVFPGGIDPHVHLDLPTPAGNSSDNFETGSMAAIAGGTTSVIDFVTPSKTQSLIEAFNERLIVAKNSLIDYGFHMGITSWNSNTAAEMKQCISKGMTSFKTYLAYKNSIGIDYNALLNIMKTAAHLDATVTVHCEDGDKIEKLQKEFIAKKCLTPDYHAASRPPEVEYESVKQILALAKIAKCKVYIVHVSTEGSVRLIKSAQLSGQKVFAETCPQYLLLDDSLNHLSGFESAKFVMSPPLRSKENAKALRKALEKGVFNVISTDHCPFNFNGQKDKGIKDFRRIPNGVGSIESRLSLLYTNGVIKEKIPLNKFVDLTSTQAAKIFGLYPQKGEIAVGSDADLVIWNPKVKNVISSKTQHQHCDYNIYEGFKTIGAPEIVIVGGKIAYALGKIKTKGLMGKYLKRKI